MNKSLPTVCCGDSVLFRNSPFASWQSGIFLERVYREVGEEKYRVSYGEKIKEVDNIIPGMTNLQKIGTCEPDDDYRKIFFMFPVDVIISKDNILTRASLIGDNMLFEDCFVCRLNDDVFSVSNVYVINSNEIYNRNTYIDFISNKNEEI